MATIINQYEDYAIASAIDMTLVGLVDNEMIDVNQLNNFSMELKGDAVAIKRLGAKDMSISKPKEGSIKADSEETNTKLLGLLMYSDTTLGADILVKGKLKTDSTKSIVLPSAPLVGTLQLYINGKAVILTPATGATPSGNEYKYTEATKTVLTALAEGVEIQYYYITSDATKQKTVVNALSQSKFYGCHITCFAINRLTGKKAIKILQIPRVKVNFDLKLDIALEKPTTFNFSMEMLPDAEMNLLKWVEDGITTA